MDVSVRAFLKRISRNVAVDEPAISKKGIRNYYDCFIQNLPNTDLRDALVSQREDYIKVFINFVQKAVRRHQNKQLQQNGKGSQPEAAKAGAKPKAATVKSSAIKKKQTPFKPTACESGAVRQQIIKLLKSNKSADVLEKQMENLLAKETALGSTDSSVDSHCEMLMMTDGTSDLHTLKNIMYLQFSSLKDESDAIITKKLKKKASRRMQAFAKFLRMCHLRRVQFGEDSKVFPSYADLVTSLLSIYLDLFLTAHRNEEVPKKEIRQACGLVKQLTRDLGEKSLDLLLQMTAADSESCACLSPLVRFLLRQKPVKKRCTHYLRYILTVAIWNDLLSDLDDIVLEARQVRAPLGFAEWAAEWEPSLGEEFPSDRKFKGRTVTAYLLDDTDTNTNLRSFLRDAIANFERNGGEYEDEEGGAKEKKHKKKKRKVADVESKADATGETEDVDEDEDLFTIDRGSGAVKTPQVVQQQKGRQTENTVEVFDLTGLDKTGGSTSVPNTSSDAPFMIDRGEKKAVKVKAACDVEEPQKKRRKRKKKAVESTTKGDEDLDESEEENNAQQDTTSDNLFIIDRGMNRAGDALDAVKPKKKKKKKVDDSSSLSDSVAEDLDQAEGKTKSEQNSSSGKLFIIDRGEEVSKKKKRKKKESSGSQSEEGADDRSKADEEITAEHNTIDRGDKTAAKVKGTCGAKGPAKKSSPVVRSSQEDDTVEVFDSTKLDKVKGHTVLQNSGSDDLSVENGDSVAVDVKGSHGSHRNQKKKVASGDISRHEKENVDFTVNLQSEHDDSILSDKNSSSNTKRSRSKKESSSVSQILANKPQRGRTSSESLPTVQVAQRETRKRTTSENVSTDKTPAAIKGNQKNRLSLKTSCGETSAETHNEELVERASAKKVSSTLSKSPKFSAEVVTASPSAIEVVSDSSDTGQSFDDVSFVRNSVSETDSQTEIVMIPDLHVHLKQTPSGGDAAGKGTPDLGSSSGRKRKSQEFPVLLQAEGEPGKKRKPAEQSQSPVALKETPKISTPKETSKISTPKETPKNATPKETPKNATPKETTKNATPKETSKSATPKETSKNATPKETPKNATPKETSKSATPKETSKNATPKETSKSATPKETSKNATPKETPKSGTPKETSKNVTPKETSKNATPKGTPKNATPKETSKNVTPKETSKNATPKETSKSATPKETSKNATPKETSKSATPKETSKNATPKETPKSGTPKETSKSATPKETSKSLTGMETLKSTTPKEMTKSSAQKKTPGANTKPLAETPKSTTPVSRRTRARKKSPDGTSSTSAESVEADASQGLKSGPGKVRSRRDNESSSPQNASLDSGDSSSSYSQNSVKAKRPIKQDAEAGTSLKSLSDTAESNGVISLHSEQDSDVVVQRKSRSRLVTSSEDADSTSSVDGSGSPARGRRVSLPAAQSKSLLVQVQKKSLRSSMGVDLKADPSVLPTKTKTRGKKTQETETRFTKLKEEPEAAASPKRNVKNAASNSPSKSSPSLSSHDIETRSKTGYNLRRGKIH